MKRVDDILNRYARIHKIRYIDRNEDAHNILMGKSGSFWVFNKRDGLIDRKTYRQIYDGDKVWWECIDREGLRKAREIFMEFLWWVYPERNPTKKKIDDGYKEIADRGDKGVYFEGGEWYMINIVKVGNRRVRYKYKYRGNEENIIFNDCGEVI